MTCKSIDQIMGDSQEQVDIPSTPIQSKTAAPKLRRRFSPPWQEQAGRRRPESIGALRALMAIGRISCAAIAIVVVGAVTALLSPFLDTGSSAKAASRFRRVSAHLICKVLGLRLRERGTRPAQNGLIVANHVSWTDGLALGAITGASFTAFARSWPIIDWLMRHFGTILIPRVPSAGLKLAVQAVAERLADGATVGVFPEGTTSFGPGVLAIKPAFFQAAIDAGTPVFVASLRYCTKAPQPSPERVVHWVDWTPFIVHAYRLISAAPITVEIRWLDGIKTGYQERRYLAYTAETLLQTDLTSGMRK